MPSEPVVSGSAASIARPAFVRSDGDGWQMLPYVSICMRRYGLESNDARTCHTSHVSPSSAHAMASDAPHCPAPVSVVSFVMPSAAL